MIEKLKALGEAAKGVLVFILTPLLFVAGFIYYLITRNDSLQGQLRRERADKELGNAISEMARAKQEADDAEKSFRETDAELARALAEFNDDSKS